MFLAFLLPPFPPASALSPLAHRWRAGSPDGAIPRPSHVVDLSYPAQDTDAPTMVKVTGISRAGSGSIIRVRKNEGNPWDWT